jgi:hypothetical protein
MSRIFCGMLVFAWSLASVSFAVEPSRLGFQPYPDQAAAPVPSGLRFTGAELSVLTGNVEGGYGHGGCNTCGEAGQCAHWTLLTWYGSWDEGHYRGCHRGARGCSSCGF